MNRTERIAAKSGAGSRLRAMSHVSAAMRARLRLPRRRRGRRAEATAAAEVDPAPSPRAHKPLLRKSSAPIARTRSAPQTTAIPMAPLRSRSKAPRLASPSPEKTPSTPIAAAAAIGVEGVFSGDGEARRGAFDLLRRGAIGMAVVCGALLVLAIGAEDFLRRGLWALGLGAGSTSAAAVASALRPLLLLGSLSLALIAALTWLIARNRLPAPLFAAILSVLFIADAARRVAGTCPAGPPDLYGKETPVVALVKKETGPGRFYDDGADDAPTVARRTREAVSYTHLTLPTIYS